MTKALPLLYHLDFNFFIPQKRIRRPTDIKSNRISIILVTILSRIKMLLTLKRQYQWTHISVANDLQIKVWLEKWLNRYTD